MPGRTTSEPRAEDDTAGVPRAPGDPARTTTGLADLCRRARQLGLTGYSGRKKATLVAMLRDH